MDLNIGLLSLIVFIVVYCLFVRKTFGLLDPLSWFLFARVAPLLTICIALSYFSDNIYYSSLFLISASLFLITFFLFTPKIYKNEIDCNQKIIRFSVKSAIVIIVIKAAILFTVSGDLPIFGASGSDSYIDFDSNNKVASSLLLGMGSADVILLSFCLPLIGNKNKKRIAIILLLLATSIALIGGKKSSLLSVIFSIALGEYMRYIFIVDQKPFFLKKTNLFAAFILSVSWAFWVFYKTIGESITMNAILDSPNFDSIIASLNFVIYQWSYPYILFVSGDLSAFFDQYSVFIPAYFFHTILSPLGFPAFDASIGPSINQFISGKMTGNGINPTFIIEGYVLFGFLLPIYAIAIAIIVGIIRKVLFQIKSLNLRILLCSLLLPALYTLPADALLFMKIVFVLIIITPLLLFLGKTRLM